MRRGLLCGDLVCSRLGEEGKVNNMPPSEYTHVRKVRDMEADFRALPAKRHQITLVVECFKAMDYESQSTVLAQCVAIYDGLPPLEDKPATPAVPHPIDDLENIVNSLQRTAALHEQRISAMERLFVDLWNTPIPKKDSGQPPLEDAHK